MVHFLRSRQTNRTIIECEVTKGDLSSAVDIEQYTKELIKQNQISIIMRDKYMFAIQELNEIRGWWWERANEEYDSCDKFVEEKFKRVAASYNLIYITD